nr:immunoglobulin heavy chain junction region [Macaca mulatta]MOX60279.1 immunoglobulin heavy chain junction region [Macaca mulatta]MOX60575.1 immunoglobulin heavy chain junction region [Macaca mulatta]MOX61611.1 immunoglobulin heavy chain junction region [Macaca mulatta]MOX62028.1 immunoglobulin heavy chain junction region [Macaca mulatta]
CARWSAANFDSW